MQEIIIYGAGTWGRSAFLQYSNRANVLFFVDSDEKRWGTDFCSILIKPPQTIKDYPDAMILIAISYGNTNAVKIARFYGAEKIKIYNPYIDQTKEYELPISQRRDPGIFVDFSLGVEHSIPTGAERLVRNLKENLLEIEKEIQPIYNMDEKIVVGKTKKGGNDRDEKDFQVAPNKIINLIRDDKLLFATTGIFGYFYGMIEKIIKNDVKLYVIVYDLYKLYKWHLISSVSRNLWIKNFVTALNCASGILCYSKVVANELQSYYRDKKIKRETPLNIYLFPLGADIVNKGKPLIVRNCLKSLFGDNQIFLMVGSIRWHKGYDIALDAFSKFMANDIKFLILGQYISSRDAPIKRKIQEAAAKQNNVIWIDDATDDEVSYCYDHATALIAASRYEGFGLSLVEAAQYGLPIICSDISVFREVTCGHATFFKVGNADSLAEALKQWLNEEKHPDSRKIPIHTWKESAEAILNIVKEKTDPYMRLG